MCCSYMLSGGMNNSETEFGVYIDDIINWIYPELILITMLSKA